MKYKVGDRVKIKSLDWYNENKDEYGYIDCGSRSFFTKMSDWCGKIATIKEICKTNCYHLEEYDFDWTDEMIECKVEDELLDEYKELTDRAFKGGYEKCKSDIELNGFQLPDGYIFKDENGNIINATKIVLEKKKKEYPKTFLGCCDVLGIEDLINRGVNGYRSELLDAFQKLLICRDAYWKIAGEEMGLDKPWEPNDSSGYCTYAIIRHTGHIRKSRPYADSELLEFPTEEMRDAFKENFKSEIEMCKELL